MRPQILSAATWAHATWLSPPRPPRDERALRQASLQLLDQYPQLADRRVHRLPIPRGRPAFARFCRLVAAHAAAAQVRVCVGANERRQLAAHIGQAHLERLQRLAPGTIEATSPIDLADRFLLTVHGLALLRHSRRDTGADTWWLLRLPRAVGEASNSVPAAERSRARRCVASALRDRKSVV